MGNKKHISDELLAAYLEGNVSKKEMTQVLQAVGQDIELQEALDIALRLEDEEEELPLQMAAEGSRNLCDVQCEAYVLKKFGVDSSVEDLLEVAKEHHWIRRVGTPLDCIGNLMEYNGLNVTRKLGATIEDIKTALAKDCGVIVAVDCDKLYPERPDEEDATNHAIVVTALDADVVTIYDPEDIEEVDIKTSLFMTAWQESRCYMVSVCK